MATSGYFERIRLMVGLAGTGIHKRQNGMLSLEKSSKTDEAILLLAGVEKVRRKIRDELLVELDADFGIAAGIADIDHRKADPGARLVVRHDVPVRVVLRIRHYTDAASREFKHR
jgi:hypothetical protein